MRPAPGQARGLDFGNQEADGILLSWRLPSLSQPSSPGGKHGCSWDRETAGSRPDLETRGRKRGALCPAPSLDGPAEAGRAGLREHGGPCEARGESRQGLSQNEARAPSRQMTKWMSFHYLCMLSFIACYAYFFYFIFV